ncbi:MAG: calcium/sodium antiporter [Bacteroidales bacterium]|nr:calcium/sodium antiporter [Bacteroidales bacterium]
MDYIKLIGGLLLLVVSGDYLVRGGVAIASKLKISTLVIGMTVVAFGTSAPELLVSVQAALMGNPEIAIGNVVGSNIANIAFILGLTALVYPLVVSKNSIKIDWPMMMIATILFLFAASNGEISRIEGLSGFMILVFFVIFQIYKSRKENIASEEQEIPQIPIWLAIVYIIGSGAGLAFGADFLIDGASNIAKSLGVSERIIGVSIVAFGTSLPELAASLSAALKKETDIAIGNIIGSNIFNILCVIGLTSLIKPINLDWNTFSYDFYWMLAISFLLLLLIIPFWIIMKKRKNIISLPEFILNNSKLGRIGGIILAISYIYYIYTLF